MEDITKINQSDPIHPEKPGVSSYGKKKHKKKKHYQQAKKHFDELTKIVEQTHKELEDNNSPFRLCIYQEGDDIFIDIVAIDDFGNTSQVFKHDISHSELENLVHHIKSGRGLILDADV
ncbi:MAG: hypothetical protein KKE44_22945 [Proteobacteria bacterium]|nr:hypothetical protein [Pseudomonadota bacterium]MBU1585592.1 hypothetical protein [Pseudomonadota bacterium]MBU2631705.1 hypothetical protein [Pseudomonadota bacterium]